MAKKALGKSVPGSVLVRILSLLEHQRLARLGLWKSEVSNVLRDHLTTSAHMQRRSLSSRKVRRLPDGHTAC